MHIHHNDLYGHALAQEPLPQGSWNLKILVDPSLVIITTYLHCSLSVLCLGVEKKIFKKYINFTLFYLQITSPWGGGYEIYTFLSPYPTYATYQIWSKLAR